MIAEFVARFDAARPSLRSGFAAKPPESYEDIVRRVVEVLGDEGGYDGPDPARITMLDHGHYQGTHVFVVAARGYQPSDYWYVRVSYGSCSGCDSLQATLASMPYDDNTNERTPDDGTLDALMLMALHIVQRMKLMDGEPAC